MYKNFNLTESEREEILNRLKENGYKQPISEQKVRPIQKPVANPELVKKYETLKELTNNLVNNVPAFVSKTLPNVIVTNNGGEGNGYYQQSNLQYRSVSVGTLTFNTTNKQVVHGKLVYSVEDRNMAEKMDLNGFAQDINRAMPQVINVYPTGYGTYSYGITFLYTEKNIDVATKLKLFQQIDPNAGNQILADLKTEYNRARYNNDNSSMKEISTVMAELNKLMGVQAPAAAPAAQPKPMNESKDYGAFVISESDRQAIREIYNNKK